MSTLLSHQKSTLNKAAPVLPGGTREPFSLKEAILAPDGYWGKWQSVNAEAILDHCDRWLETVGAIDNLRLAAAGQLPQGRRGLGFSDSDVYKLLEAMCWEQGRQPRQALEARIKDLSAIIAAAQEPDGYLNTNFGRPGQAGRYADLEWGHELYSYGHLIQAAVARLRCHGPDRLVEVALRAADHLCQVFGPEGREAVCGHPCVEVALIELARATGQDRYRDQAQLFIDRRGHGLLGEIGFGPAYFQDDIPVRQTAVLHGHAVRAVYLAAAATDLAIDQNDTSLLAVVGSQWRRTIAARTYLTGAMGARREDEAFGEDFELPSDVAYGETCAGVGALMWSWRLLLATGEAGYADFMERVLCNVIATSPAADGQAFFYSNTLHQRIDDPEPTRSTPSPRAVSASRAPWFEVSCCPPNVARTLASLGSYMGWADEKGLTLALYSPMTLATRLPDGRAAQVSVETDYPASGRIVVQVAAADAPWDLTLRVPAWAEGATLRREGGDERAARPGWVTISQVGRRAESIELVLPTEPRFTAADPRINAVGGALAVERGPLVYCLESTDIGGINVDQAWLDGTVPPRPDGQSVIVQGGLDQLGPAIWPYGSPAPIPDPDQATGELRLVPYNQWGRRGPSTMEVWIRTRPGPGVVV